MAHSLNTVGDHGGLSRQRRSQYSMVPLSFSVRGSPSQQGAVSRRLKREGAVMFASRIPVGGWGLRREEAVVFADENLSPGTHTVVQKLKDAHRSTSDVHVPKSPHIASSDVNIFAGDESTIPKAGMEYRLLFKSPPLSPSYLKSPPSTPSPMDCQGYFPTALPSLRRRASGTHTRSPLCATPLTNDTESITVGGAGGRLVLDGIDCKDEVRPASSHFSDVYIVGGGDSARSTPEVFRLTKPSFADPVTNHYYGDAMEMKVLHLGYGDNVKTFHALNLQTDANIPVVDKNKTHYQLAPKVLGWVPDIGISVDDFNTFCAQCKDCKRYSSSRAMHSCHVCPENISMQTIDLVNVDVDIPKPSQVSTLYEAFHSARDNSGITAAEVQFLFVICWRCEKVMTRIAALDHIDVIRSTDISP